MVEFEEDDDVTPLPCDKAHYFHESCIETWIKTKPECPLCRTEITYEQLQEQKAKLA